MNSMFKHYHIQVPAKHYGRAVLLRTAVIDESIKQTVYQIAKDHGINDVYVLSEDEVVKALKEYLDRKDDPNLVEDLRLLIKVLEQDNKTLKDEILNKDTTLNNALAAIRRQKAKHDDEVAELNAEIARLNEVIRVRNNTIAALLDAQEGTTVEVPQDEKFIPDCGYYHEGRCKAQKMMPECTPYESGSCPVAGRDSISSHEL